MTGGCGCGTTPVEIRRAMRATDAAMCVLCRHNPDHLDPRSVCGAGPAGRPALHAALLGACPIGRHAVPTVEGVSVDRGTGGGTPVVAPVVTWLGVRWYGVPMPLRVWGWLTVRGFGRPWGSPRGLPGCGCIVVLKRRAVAARAWAAGVWARATAETWGARVGVDDA